MGGCRVSQDPASLTLGSHAAEVARARSHVHGLCGKLPTQVRDLAVLLTSEIVTNAIQHGLGPLVLRVAQTDGSLRVEVTDTGPGMPDVRQPSTTRTHGRGMQIVESLASAWGVVSHPAGDGKTVWFSIAT